MCQTIFLQGARPSQKVQVGTSGLTYGLRYTELRRKNKLKFPVGALYVIVFPRICHAQVCAEKYTWFLFSIVFSG